MITLRAGMIAVVAFCIAVLGQSPAMAADRLVLAELFTSQSCSSCPPADAILGELAQREGILALSFHVDYWDGAGWTDPFALHMATTRQQQYAALLDTQVYTPQLVIAGRAETVGSDRRSVEALLRREAAAGAPSAALRRSNGHFEIHIDGAAAAAAKPAADILLVTYDPTHKTPVRGGENGGRFLVTYNDVRSLRALGTWHGEAASLDVASNANEVGERAAVIVQSADGTIWALATTNPGTNP